MQTHFNWLGRWTFNMQNEVILQIVQTFLSGANQGMGWPGTKPLLAHTDCTRGTRLQPHTHKDMKCMIRSWKVSDSTLQESTSCSPHSIGWAWVHSKITLDNQGDSAPTNAPSIGNLLWLSCGWTITELSQFPLGNLSCKPSYFPLTLPW